MDYSSYLNIHIFWKDGSVHSITSLGQALAIKAKKHWEKWLPKKMAVVCWPFADGIRIETMNED